MTDRAKASANNVKLKATPEVPLAKFFGPESARAAEDRTAICAMHRVVIASRAPQHGGLHELDQAVVPT